MFKNCRIKLAVSNISIILDKGAETGAVGTYEENTLEKTKATCESKCLKVHCLGGKITNVILLGF